jgi:STE24 endopeptidase
MAVDPAAATTAYLRTLDSAVVERSIAYTHEGHLLLVISKLLTMAVCLVVFRSGLVGRVADAASRGGSRPNRASFVAGAVFLLAEWILLLPFEAYADWSRDRRYGLSHEGLGEWLAQAAVQGSIDAVVGGLLLVALYAVMRRTGRRWWIWCGAGGVLVSVAAVALLPVLSTSSGGYRPLPAGPVRQALDQIARRAGMKGEEIVVFDPKGSDRYSASVTGAGSVGRISLGAAVVREPVDLPAVRAVVAHEIGHYRRHHVVLLGLMVAALVAVGALLLHLSFDMIAGWMPRGRAVSLSDPAGMPVVFLFAAVFTLATTPIVNWGLRSVEADADRYGLALAREPDGAARALLATADYRAPSPSWIEEALFYDHPSIERRIRRAMEWKAENASAVARR